MPDNEPAKPLSITPETKIGALLETYPELESVLINLAPAFRKLKNPVLRRTVARVATLRSAAQMAGIEVGELVHALRRAAGIRHSNAARPIEIESARRPESEPIPAWVKDGNRRSVIDVDRLLAAGEHPLTEIRKQLRGIDPGEHILLTGEFKPQPLIDTFTSESIPVFSRRIADSRWETYVGRI